MVHGKEKLNGKKIAAAAFTAWNHAYHLDIANLYVNLPWIRLLNRQLTDLLRQAKLQGLDPPTDLLLHPYRSRRHPSIRAKAH